MKAIIPLLSVVSGLAPGQVMVLDPTKLYPLNGVALFPPMRMKFKPEAQYFCLVYEAGEYEKLRSESKKARVAEATRAGLIF